jgi:hypothetical protein
MNESEALEARLAARVASATKARRDLAALQSFDVTQPDLEGVKVGEEVTLADGVFRFSGSSNSGTIDLTSLADEDAEAIRAARELADTRAYVMANMHDVILKLLHPDPVEPEIAPADFHNFPENLADPLSKWGEVGGEEASLTTADLTEEVIQKLTAAKRKKFTELLNVELAELQQERGGPREALSREAEIEKLLGLFACVGEM